MNEAQLEDSGSGLAPSGDGWFVVNVRDTEWVTSETFGSGCMFESRDASFPQVGINISVLEPGEPNCLYHSESLQEAFLVLSGECKLLVEGEERLLEPWDFVHCPAGTEHVFVGAGDGPCAILMIGARSDDEQLLYPVSELAGALRSERGAGDAGPEAGIRAVRAAAIGEALLLESASMGLALSGRPPVLVAPGLTDARVGSSSATLCGDERDELRRAQDAAVPVDDPLVFGS